MRWTHAFCIILMTCTLSSLSSSLSINDAQIHYFVAESSTFGPEDFQDDHDNGVEQWQLSKEPAANATGHLVFETVSSLLQHWPNTRYRNGHSIVPGVISPGTLLYHGTNHNVVPDHPDWLATDPEHSHAFCHGTTQAGCWHLTLATTRPLRVLYFDGSSAAKMMGGPLDSQDIVAWGKVRPERTYNERQRIADLCAWGHQYSLDAFIRMEWDFEIMLCNFTSGAKVVSFLNLPELPALEKGIPPSQNQAAFRVLEAINAGHWHDRYPGEERIRLDLTRLISFYDIDLVPSLVADRIGKERWDHRLQGADSADIAAVRRRLARDLVSERLEVSGIDWRTLFRVIIKRYAERLELVQYLLNDANSDSEVFHDEYERAAKVQLQLRIMLTPYILHSSIPIPTSNFSASGLSWPEPVFKECARHTHQQLCLTLALH
ncbi:hypothetical protein BV22DRAFT_1091365 [Leucogyrophana mollusca]|uniref:Uncharacterized protein n=1 Tax=Leucogyrophana mollusca TaxID=85980 RepID=A0ACB8BH47_9AGAM|nr:hypothetical protein BV22DRAFT_1091365 [Leucogyrophana mollusca]